MPTIDTAKEAQEFVNELRMDHARVTQFREIIDRRMRNLDQFRKVLESMAKHLASAWFPYQGADAGTEFQTLKQLLVGNRPRVSVTVRSREQRLVNMGQELEDFLEPLNDVLYPLQVELDECSFLGDGYGVETLEPKEAGPELAKFGDGPGYKQGQRRFELDEYAAKARRVKDDDDSPEARYYRALQGTVTKRKPKGDRNQAYIEVTEEAQLRDGLRWRVRIIDPLTFGWFDDGQPENVESGCETGYRMVNPLLSAFSGYGLHQDARGRLEIRNEKGKTASYAVLSGLVSPDDGSGVATRTSRRGRSVKFHQIKCKDGIYVFIEHPGGKSKDDPGIVMKFPNPFGGTSTGYYVLAGDTKLRDKHEDRYDPPILGVLVEQQQINLIRSGVGTMALAEAARGLYELDTELPVPPLEGTEGPKSIEVKDQELPPVAAGEIQRVPSTGVDLKFLQEIASEKLEQHKSREFFVGNASSSETGIHLARLQTAVLTKLLPYNIMRAETHKRVLTDFLCMVAYSGMSFTLPFSSKKDLLPGEKPKVEMRRITPAHAMLPIDVLYELGADTKESEYARAQMSRQETEFGTWGISRHRENVGDKDPYLTEVDMAVDGLLRMTVFGDGQNPGILASKFVELMTRYLEDRSAQLLGPAPAPPPPPPMILGPDGLPLMMPPADGGGRSPVQIQPGGTPVAPGAGTGAGTGI